MFLICRDRYGIEILIGRLVLQIWPHIANWEFYWGNPRDWCFGPLELYWPRRKS